MRLSIEPDEGFTPSPYPLPRRGEGKKNFRRNDEMQKNPPPAYRLRVKERWGLALLGAYFKSRSGAHFHQCDD